MKFRLKAKTQESTPPVVHLATLCTILLTVIVLYNNFGGQPFPVTSSRSSFTRFSTFSKPRKGCDIFTGEWVPNPEAPYYTNETCWAIHNHQNCLKHGRPDTEYPRWRWKPRGCELPVFNPAEFLELLRGKSMAFVGDSMARNQVQSLICLLSRVEYPEDVSPTKHLEFKRWRYVTYNFTLAVFWSPYLVKAKEAHNSHPPHAGQFNLYLDEFDEEWTGKMAEFSHIIISAGHWFTRPVIYYENHRRVGGNFENTRNGTRLSTSYGYGKAFRTAFRALNSMKGFRGIIYLRTFSPSHFEGGPWDKGGHCQRTRPFKGNETSLEGTELDFYQAQVEEFRKAKEEGRKKGLKYRLLDTTRLMFLRPDGHPSTYGHWPHERLTLYNDCVHWCLPGPIDTWNDFLLEIMKTDIQS